MAKRRSLPKNRILSVIDTRVDECHGQVDQHLAMCSNTDEVNIAVYRASIERSVYKSLRLEFENIFEEE